jgi:predicted Zn-ribbon and HTH transcriptional regulator
MVELPKAFKCYRCDHEWLSKMPGGPQMCPRCKSYKWNEPKKEKKEMN